MSVAGAAWQSNYPFKARDGELLSRDFFVSRLERIDPAELSSHSRISSPHRRDWESELQLSRTNFQPVRLQSTTFRKMNEAFSNVFSYTMSTPRTRLSSVTPSILLFFPSLSTYLSKTQRHSCPHYDVIIVSREPLKTFVESFKFFVFFTCSLLYFSK